MAQSNVATLPPTAPQPGESKIWSKDQLAAIEAHGDLISDVKKSRKALNDTVAASRSNLIAEGFNQSAIDAAMAYHNTPEKDRDNWDETYLFARRAFGVPIQEDLFMAAMADQVTVTVPNKEQEQDED